MRLSSSSRPRGGLGRLLTAAAGLLLALFGVQVVAGPAHAEPEVTVTDSADPATVGTSYSYTVGFVPSDEVTRGRLDLSGASATITGVSSSNASFVCNVSSSTRVDCSANTPYPHGPLSFTVTVTPLATGTVTARGSYTDGTSTAYITNESTTINPASGTDLGASVTDSADPVSLGNTLTDTVTVTNNGPTGATGVTAAIALSGASAGIVSATPSQGSCTVSAPNISCSLGSLANAASATIAVKLSPAATGTITATATVDATESDPTSSNDSASQSTTVNNGLGCTITGTNGNDTLNGTSGADVICGLGGQDDIIAGGGNDTVYAGPGNDTVDGGNDDDTLYGGDGDDAMGGGNGADYLYGEAGSDTNDGETLLGSLLHLFDNGADHIYGGPGNDDLDGQNGNDVLYDHDGTDTMAGGVGNDDIDVQDGVSGDTTNGGLGSDTCTVDAGDTTSSC